MNTPRAYVSEQLSIILGTAVDPTERQVAQFWQAFSRQEEIDARKDQHGNFPPEASEFARQGLLESPPLHADILDLQCRHAQAQPRWPRGHRFAVCLTHDVDRIVQWPWRERWRQLAYLRRAISTRQKLRWAAAGGLYAVQDALRRSNRATYDFWLAEEGRFGFHSTFFVLPERPVTPTFYDHFYRYADPIRFHGHRMSFAEGTRRVREAGWGIGVHGSYMGAYDAEVFRQEKAQVEEMLGAEVQTSRQHFLRFAPEITPGVQASAGIRADATLGFSTVIGCRAGLAFPFFWPGERELLEVPLVIQDVGLLRIHGKDLDLPAAIARAKTLMSTIAEAGGVVTLCWHTHPESPGACEAYRALLRTAAELGGWGCSLEELYAWWHARRETLRENGVLQPAAASAAPDHVTEARSMYGCL